MLLGTTMNNSLFFCFFLQPYISISSGVKFYSIFFMTISLLLSLLCSVAQSQYVYLAVNCLCCLLDIWRFHLSWIFIGNDMMYDVSWQISLNEIYSWSYCTLDGLTSIGPIGVIVAITGIICWSLFPSVFVGTYIQQTEQKTIPKEL